MKKYLLIKFGSFENLSQLQKQGKVYCKDLKYFSQLKDENIRGDEFEAVVELKYMENAIFSLKPANKPESEWKNIKTTYSQLRTSIHEPIGNLFCMSAIELEISQDQRTLQLSSNFSKFESFYLMINNAIEFLDRIRKAIDDLGYKYDEGNVEYFDLKKTTGEKSILIKDVEYKWQEEYRFYIRSELSEPLILEIGNIEDISTIYEFEKCSKFVYKSPFGASISSKIKNCSLAQS